MKKIIAVSIALAVVAGSAFAQFNSSWGGIIFAGINLVQGGNDYGKTAYSDPTTADPDNVSTMIVGRGLEFLGRFTWNASFQTENMGTIFARGRLTSSGAAATGESSMSMDGQLRWRPNDMIHIGIGADNRNIIGTNMNYIWPLESVDMIGVAMAPSYEVGNDIARAGFNGGFTGGLALSVTPMGNSLGLQLGLPYAWWEEGDPTSIETLRRRSIENVIRNATVRAFYNIEGGQVVGASYVGGLRTLTDMEGGGEQTVTSLGNIFAFYQNYGMVDGLLARLGVRVQLPTTTERDIEGAANTSSSTATAIIIGLSSDYDTGSVGVKLNVGALLRMGGEAAAAGNGNVDTRGSASANGTMIDAELIPYYRFANGVLAMLAGGFGISMPGSDYRLNDNEIQSAIWWAVSPYVVVNMGNANRSIMAGFRIYGNNGAPDPANGERPNATLNWAIPIAMGFAW